MNKWLLYYMKTDVEKACRYLENLVLQDVKAGVAGGATITLSHPANEIVSVMAVVTATGAPATKFLLAPTTDYVLENGNLKCVTNQSANTLIVNYR